MPLPRIFHDSSLKIGEQVLLTPQAYDHLVKVLRMGVGADLVVFNGLGGEFKARIVAIGKRKLTIEVGSFYSYAVESPLQIHLGQALLKSDKMDFVIQKAVELGVTTVTPLLTQRSVIKLSGQGQAKRLKQRLKRWEAIAIAACEQCGRNSLPRIEQIVPLNTWVMRSPKGCAYVLNPLGKAQLPPLNKVVSEVICLLGPEGGFTKDEISLAEHNGFDSLSLGKRILRAETATIATLAILQSRWGDVG